jgi:hypothetical protein
MPPKIDKEVEKQLKALWKAIGDIEKRLKFVEDRGKVLADSLTSPKDLEKLMDVHIDKMVREQKDTMKATERRMEIQEKLYGAQEKQWKKEAEKLSKEGEKQAKEAMKEFEKQRLDARLTTLEAIVAKLGK